MLYLKLFEEHRSGYNTDSFIKRAKELHGDKYYYSKVDYKHNKTPVEIICPEHGEFFQMPNSHLQKQGCPKCSGSFKLDTNSFIEKAKKIHGDKFDYSKVDYINTGTPVEIICPDHGSFLQKPGGHISMSTNRYNSGGCPKCSGKSKSNTEEFVEKAKKVHTKYDYDYSKIKYTNATCKIEVVCKKHGSFFTQANNFLGNISNCPFCTGGLLNTDDFIEKASIKHNHKYDYSKSIYINSKTPVEIICKKHGPFLQLPGSHLYGNRGNGSGCPKCNQSTGEMMIYKILLEYGYEFEIEKKFKSLGRYRFDFYLPKQNMCDETCIEYDGIQHYEPIIRSKNADSVEKAKERFEMLNSNDIKKTQYCIDNNIKLIRIPYTVNKKDDIELYLIDGGLLK